MGMSMKMQRPSWTICFFLIWVIIFIAVICLHAALGKTVPAIEDFPENLKKGFMEVFKFEQMKDMAMSIETDSTTALAMCDINSPATTCPTITSQGQSASALNGCNSKTPDTTTQKSSILDTFKDGLKKIDIVVHDEYLGTPAMSGTASSIDSIESEMTSIGATATCCVTAPSFCVIYDSAQDLYDAYDTVKAEIDKFTTGPAIKDFNDGAAYLKFLHILPWILVLSTIFFSIMWSRNGACCCCSNGSMVHFCLLVVPMAIFWLLCFIIMTIFASIGYAFQFVVLEMKVEDLNGQPTVENALDHFQTRFPEFWDIVFKELEEGLALFRTSATIYVLVCIIIVVYGCLFCCCRPYGKGSKADADAAMSGV